MKFVTARATTDSKINAVADLKGKVLATNGLGSGVHMAMTAVLQKAGLQDKRDYTTIEVPFPTMTAILKDGKADLITSLPPFVFASDLRRWRALFLRRKTDLVHLNCPSGWLARALSRKSVLPSLIFLRTIYGRCVGIRIPPTATKPSS
jgi:NMT1/THI5 like